MSAIEKKVTARERRAKAVRKFKRWNRAHPDAPLELKIRKFDQYCDAEVK